MFLPALNLVFRFFSHFVKRSLQEINNVFRNLRYGNYLSLQNDSRFSSKVDNLHKKKFCNVDYYIFQDKDSEISLNLGFIKINGNVKLNGKVEGLKNITEICYSSSCKRSDISTMIELEASELSLHYDGIIKLSSISREFIVSAVLKNVQISVEFKMYPFESIIIYLDDVKINELKIEASISGQNVISSIINLVIIYTFKIMSFMNLCLLEFFTKNYLNETFMKFCLALHKPQKKVCNSTIRRALDQMKCFREKIQITQEMFYESKFSPISYISYIMNGLFDCHKDYIKVIISQAFNGNTEDFHSNSVLLKVESDLSSTQSSESESSSSSSSTINAASESEFISELRPENRINSNESNSETEDDSQSIENDYNETISTLSETSFENEINYQNANDSCDANALHFEENYNENESQSENSSCDDVNIELEPNTNECESQLNNDSSDKSSDDSSN